jgi:hypothetical protein
MHRLFLARDDFSARASGNFQLRRAVLNKTLPGNLHIECARIRKSNSNFMFKSFFLSLGQLTAAMLSFAAALFIFAVSQPAVVAQSATVATATQKTLSAKERAEVFEKVWQTIDEKYYDPKFNGVDWKAVREKYQPLIEMAASDAYVILISIFHLRFSAYSRRSFV